MRTVDLLRAVRDGAPINAPAIAEFVRGVSDGTVPDYQASAFLMAVTLRGLAPEATAALTVAMRDSGRCIDLSALPGHKVDKHSTGGVGDKISIPLGPLVAACGVSVPMISGRGLGHTGGTRDKLESIKGFRTDFGVDDFCRLVRDVGCCLSGQTEDIAPADKKLYALRDVTATVESVPLITASILAKKLAEGIDALVLDVKVGRGAFMRTLAEAEVLATSLVRVGGAAGLKVRAVLTRMDEPLGNTIGNALEVRESIDILNNCGPPDTTELTLTLAAHMLSLGGKGDLLQTRALAEAALRGGEAKKKFAEVIATHGGDPRVLDDLSLLPQAQFQSVLQAPTTGYVQDIDAYALGTYAMLLGAGRAKASDSIDHAVGLQVCRKVGDAVARGEPLFIVHHNRPLPTPLDTLATHVQIGSEKPPVKPHILGLID